MDQFIARLNKNPYFRFLSSVQLAIPLLLVLMSVVAAGTIVESRYNTEYARLMVYDTWWFGALMIALWLNIFLSTISRYPYKLRHTGFVIVHIGMLTLLAGGWITKFYGVDGQMRVVEHESGATVELGDLSLELIDVQSDSAIKVPFARTASRLTGSSLDFLNDHFNSKIIVRDYLPFAEIREGVEITEPGAQAGGADPSGPVAVGFMIKSQFFDVSEWLQSQDKPEIHLGPATIRLVIDSRASLKESDKPKSKPRKVKSAAQPHGSPSTATVARDVASSTASAANGSDASGSSASATSNGGAGKKASGLRKVIVKDEASGKVLMEVPIEKFKAGLQLPKGVILSAAKFYQNAVVMQNHLAEGEPGKANPALEMTLSVSGQNVREVSYAKFPSFSLTQGKAPAIGLKFSYETDQVAAESVEPDVGAHAMVQGSGGNMSSSGESDPPSVGAAADVGGASTGAGSQGSRAGNVIEFHASPGGGEKVLVVLFKNDKKVGGGVLTPGESLVTPWMGMKITLGSVKQGSVSNKTEAVPAQLQPRTELPPSAVFVTTAGSQAEDGFWLADGQFRRVSILGREYEVYFGHRTMNLPLSVQLLEFKKQDYPGTATPMSFSSRVKVNGESEEITVSMNEPLKRGGYTFYQSSYDIRPGQPRASIFSVNRDPGRPVKYIGGLILALGIITFTLMRSRVYHPSKKGAT